MTRSKLAITIIACIALVAGCAKQSDPSVEQKLKLAPSYSVVRVFYGTDRNAVQASGNPERYGTDRGEISYGTCDVSIPRDHRMGELEAPSILKLQFREAPEKHVVVLSVDGMTDSTFFGALKSRVEESSEKKTFVFVHGYNVSFVDAARRTAQMSYDLGFDGAPVFYSWPSQATLAGYTVDENNVEWSKPNVKAFLEDVIARSGATTVYLIAHSMGNRALTGALVSMDGEQARSLGTVVKDIILTAPDIDAAVFKRQIAPRLMKMGSSVTLYASSQDKALLASKKIHKYPRAGDAGASLVLMKGLETIDASDVETSFLGHSYFAESSSVLSDIFYLIKDGKPANERLGLLAMETPRGNYWKVRKE